jgi:hypothetical protein
MTKTRLALLVVALIGVCLLVKKLDSHPRRDLVGTAVACTNAFPFRDKHAEILEYGLQDVRGLACDGSGQSVFIAEGQRSVLVYSTQSGSLVKSRRLLCPEAPCQVADRRGLAFGRRGLYVAEHGRGQIILRNLTALPNALSATGDLDSSMGLTMPLVTDVGALKSPSGVAISDEMLFISDDPASEASTEANGALYTCASAECKLQLIADHLQHPSGIAAASKDGPVYVAERRAHRVEWLIFSRTPSGAWVRSGALGSAPFPTSLPQSFLGIAVNDTRSMIFAAGPGGLYVFGNSGRHSGQILFDDPISGIATCGQDLYFVTGHMLCRLKIPDLPSNRQIAMAANMH